MSEFPTHEKQLQLVTPEAVTAIFLDTYEGKETMEPDSCGAPVCCAGNSPHCRTWDRGGVDRLVLSSRPGVSGHQQLGVRPVRR